MRKFLFAAGALGFATLGSSAAMAQFSVDVGPGGARVRGPVYEERVIERRPRRRVCRTEYRTRINRFGERVTRPVEVCTTRGGPRY